SQSVENSLRVLPLSSTPFTRIGLPFRSSRGERDLAAYWPTSRRKIGGLTWYSTLIRGIVSDENREPSDLRAIVSREKLSELRIAVVGRTSSAASMRELLPGAASRKIGTAPLLTLAVPPKNRYVGVVTLA